MAFDIVEMRRKAENGGCPSQCVLGLCYLYGIEVDVDYNEAFRFLTAAAKQGSSRAILNLGRMYAQGLGIPPNVPEAMRLFESVARPSDGSDAFPARIELGRIFSRGLGVSIDRNLAHKWYSSAIELAVENEDDPEDVKEARDYVEGAS